MIISKKFSIPNFINQTFFFLAWRDTPRCTSRSRISAAWAPLPSVAPRWAPSDACWNDSVGAPRSRSARTEWSCSFKKSVKLFLLFFSCAFFLLVLFYAKCYSSNQSAYMPCCPFFAAFCQDSKSNQHRFERWQTRTEHRWQWVVCQLGTSFLQHLW